VKAPATGSVTAPDRATASSRGRQRGSGTVLVLGVCAVVMILAVAGLAVAGAAVSAHVAATAADLAAIAAATARVQGAPDACASGAAVAAANASTLTRCTLLADDSVQVTVESAMSGTDGRLTRWLGGGAARAVARAGPVVEVGG